MSFTINPDLSIVIPAAGEGRRLGLGPKALLTLQNRSLLYWVSQKARQIAAEVIVAVPPNMTQDWEQHCPACRIIEGGDTHLESMAKLARQANRDIVMNLNVAMPFASPQLIHKVADAAKETGIAGAFLELDLPLARIQEGIVAQLIPRQQCAIASGPNAYLRETLLALINKADAEDWSRQSFLEIAMRYGMPIKAIAGERNNIKITNSEDWAMAQTIALSLL